MNVDLTTFYYTPCSANPLTLRLFSACATLDDISTHKVKQDVNTPNLNQKTCWFFLTINERNIILLSPCGFSLGFSTSISLQCKLQLIKCPVFIFVNQIHSHCLNIKHKEPDSQCLFLCKVTDPLFFFKKV